MHFPDSGSLAVVVLLGKNQNTKSWNTMHFVLHERVPRPLPRSASALRKSSEGLSVQSQCGTRGLRTFSIWYVTPGKVARNPLDGLISASWMGITPHTPCTPSCTQNTPAASVLKPLGRIRNGMHCGEKSKLDRCATCWGSSAGRATARGG